MNPIGPYPGSKQSNGTWHTIINQIPPFEEYWELFAGSGTIFWNLRMVDHIIINDNLHQTIEQIEDLIWI